MYGIHINKDALKYVNSLAEKSKRSIKRKLEILKEDPHPGRDDKKKLQLPDHRSGYPTVRVRFRMPPPESLMSPGDSCAAKRTGFRVLVGRF